MERRLEVLIRDLIFNYYTLTGHVPELNKFTELVSGVEYHECFEIRFEEKDSLRDFIRKVFGKDLGGYYYDRYFSDDGDYADETDSCILFVDFKEDRDVLRLHLKDCTDFGEEGSYFMFERVAYLMGNRSREAVSWEADFVKYIMGVCEKGMVSEDFYDFSDEAFETDVELLNRREFSTETKKSYEYSYFPVYDD